MVEEISELPPIGKSDHVCQKWEVIVKEALYRNTTMQRPNFNRADWQRIKTDVKCLSLKPDEPSSAMMDKFVDMVNKTKKVNVPLCRPRSTKHRLPWMRGARIKKQRTERWRRWKKFKETGLPRDYDSYKLERNKLNDVIREAKKKYEQGLIADLKEKPNLYFSHCRRSLKTKQGVTNVIDGEGRLTETEIETATALNTYYHSVFTCDDPNSINPPFAKQTQECLSDINLSTETVEDILLSLNPNKAAGPDGVETRMMKECAEEMAPKLQTIFRKSIDDGEVPRQWKDAHIIPIHKGGSKAVMSNFRPVALKSTICKVLEKIVCAVILSFLTMHNLITPQQHGFVKGRSCQTNIMLCLEKWTRMVDDGGSVVPNFKYRIFF